jgi:hypothetical protein
VPAGCTLIDWFLATRAWVNGARLSFDEEPEMYYRQHASNTARVLLPLTAAQVLEGTRRVLDHYGHVLESGMPGPPWKQGRLVAAWRQALQFYRSVSGSAARLNRYVRALGELRPPRVWWWFVAHPDLEDLWRD